MWVIENRKHVDTQTVNFPHYQRVLNIGDGKQPNFLEIPISALEDTVCDLDAIFQPDCKRFHDMPPETFKGTIEKDIFYAIKTWLIFRLLPGKYTSEQLADRRFSEEIFSQVQQIVRHARRRKKRPHSVFIDPRFNFQEELVKRLKDDLDLGDLYTHTSQVFEN